MGAVALVDLPDSIDSRSVLRPSIRIQLSRGNACSPPRRITLPKIKEDAIVLEGTIVESLPNAMFRVELEEGPVVLVRTRPDNVIDRPGHKVALQIDGVDNGNDGGWSVLVRGVLAATEPDPRLDSHPLLAEGRDAWRLIVPTRITGRRLVGDPDRWTFHPLGYL